MSIRNAHGHKIAKPKGYSSCVPLPCRVWESPAPIAAPARPADANPTALPAEEAALGAARRGLGFAAELVFRAAFFGLLALFLAGLRAGFFFVGFLDFFFTLLARGALFFFFFAIIFSLNASTSGVDAADIVDKAQLRFDFESPEKPQIYRRLLTRIT